MKQGLKTWMVPSVALLLTAPLAAQDRPEVTLPVSAHMDLYRAGGYNDSSDGTAPASYGLTARAGQALIFSSVTGSWTCASGVTEYGPDGTTGGRCFHPGGQNINNPIGPFSGYNLTDFVGALAGVFLEDTLPASAPPPLRFYAKNNSLGGIHTNFQTITPLIGQVFYIGDGRLGFAATKGTKQVFRVPPTATHLYLGYIDNCGASASVGPGCYSDNAGSLTATFRIQAFDWVAPILTTAPAVRCCVGMAYDPEMRATVLFGGAGGGNYYNETWIWRSGWRKLSTSTAPSGRQGAGMVWDASAKNIVLFGGVDASGTSLNDTWTWDGTNWTQQFPPVSPPARRFDTTGMAYDAATKTVVFFGGIDSHSNFFGDTWTWDGVAKIWTQQSPATTPSPRRTMIAYDDVHKTVVLFSGTDANGALGDTWIWDGTTWTQQHPATSPSPRGQGSMAFDASLGLIVLFAGSAPGTYGSNDTWVWGGTNWTQLRPIHQPPPRYSAGIAYDPMAPGLVVFGGFNPGLGLNDTWLFTPAR